MHTLYLVRHGENKANLTKEFSHRRVDYPLTPRGRLQSEQTGEFFKDKQVDELYSSPLKRAVETAEIIGREIGRKVTVMENFREINVGDLEGRPPTAENWQLYLSIVKEWLTGDSDPRFPGGENYRELWRRMRDGVHTILNGKPDRTVVVVGHGGIFVSTLKDLCPEFDVQLIYEVENHNCSVTTIMVEQQNDRLVGKVVRYAAYDHLKGEAAQLTPGLPTRDR